MTKRIIAIILIFFLFFTFNTVVFATGEQSEQTGEVIYVYADNDYNDEYSGQGEIDTTIDHSYTPLSQEQLEDIQTREEGSEQASEIENSFSSGGSPTFYNAGDSVFVVSDDNAAYIHMMQSYLAIMAGLNDTLMDQTLPEYNTGFILYNEPMGLLEDTPYYQRILGNEMQDHLSLDYADMVVGSPGLSNKNWSGIFNEGQYTVRDLGGQSLCFPTDSAALYKVI